MRKYKEGRGHGRPIVKEVSPHWAWTAPRTPGCQESVQNARCRKEDRADGRRVSDGERLAAFLAGNPISGGTSSSLTACTVSKLTLVVERRAAPLGLIRILFQLGAVHK